MKSNSYSGNGIVLLGRDHAALSLLIPLHSRVENPFILDCTFNKGGMWKKCDYQPNIRMDLRLLPKIDTVGDFTALPFKSETFDIVVFDPPHLPNAAGSRKSSKMWWDRYGLTDMGRDGGNVVSLFYPFFLEARRVLKPKGIVLAKIADLVHNHRYQWQQVALVLAAQEAGMTPCDMLIKADPNAGKLKSSKWQNQKHLRKSHCYWIVVRNSKYCE